MHASDSLYDYLVRNLPSVHLSRLKSVFMAVDSLLKGGQLSLTALGRSAVTATTPKHNIKRIDRLLGNDKLYNEIESFCREMTKLIINLALLRSSWWIGLSLVRHIAPSSPRLRTAAEASWSTSMYSL